MRLFNALVSGLLVAVPTAIAEAGDRVAFPLRVSDNHRHLVDAEGRPFLVAGDTAWSLIADLTPADIEKYFDDRAERGFNSVIVNLIENKFATNAPRNRAGVEPFLVPGDFARPNPAYFEAARAALTEASERGIAVWLCPAYLGWQGGDEGFFQQIEASGPKALRAYGRFVGERFRDVPNIVWMPGGDYAAPEDRRWAIVELAEGIRDGGAARIMTIHGGNQSAVDVVGERPWLDLNNTYSYEPKLFRLLRRDYERKPIRPFVLIETTYENEHDARPEQIRRQAYWAMTSGAAGQFFGNNPIWHFDGPGLFPAPRTWREELDGRGSRDMSRLRSIFHGRAWHELVPDWSGRLVTQGVGEGVETITAAATPDGSLAVVYVPSNGRQSREVTIELSRVGRATRALWINPTDGTSKSAVEGAFKPEGTRAFRTPGDNGTGTNDWVLILE